MIKKNKIREAGKDKYHTLSTEQRQSYKDYQKKVSKRM